MADYKARLIDLLSEAVKQDASDLHIAVGQKPMLRKDGSLVALESESVLNPKDAEGLVLALLNPDQKNKFLEEKQLDFAYDLDGRARFRINAYFQRGFMSAALRLISAKVKTLEELGLPMVLREFAKLSQGLLLAVGPAGQGKSTTLAVVVDEINRQRADHIITIEDPIEYLFEQNKSIISQREVRLDTLTFHDALRSVLRQDPDAIMIGEMRDAESIASALTAAETGHLVLSTLHTNSASQTIDRIVDSFPSGQQPQIISQLASTLIGIVSKRLIPKIGGGRVPACEIMIMNPAIRNLIREKKFFQIDNVIETSKGEGMISLNRSLSELVKAKQITPANAELYSISPKELKLMLK
ncbi:MAG: type IV pilus twitching motility protein PilT [bacterium]|nr:type IV pilus twitching motility protein PilT [bacterium]